MYAPHPICIMYVYVVYVSVCICLRGQKAFMYTCLGGEGNVCMYVRMPSLMKQNLNRTQKYKVIAFKNNKKDF
jgi:hypothetical protein